jgi:hypothetical protein
MTSAGVLPWAAGHVQTPPLQVEPEICVQSPAGNAPGVQEVPDAPQYLLFVVGSTQAPLQMGSRVVVPGMYGHVQTPDTQLDPGVTDSQSTPMALLPTALLLPTVLQVPCGAAPQFVGLVRPSVHTPPQMASRPAAPGAVGHSHVPPMQLEPEVV